MGFKFEELRVYQDGVQFSSDVFLLTKNWKGSFFTLADQLNRAALSIPLNIAEGSGKTHRDFLHFLSISRGSCYECVPILTVAMKNHLLDQKQYDKFYGRVMQLAKSVTALRNGISTYSTK